MSGSALDQQLARQHFDELGALLGDRAFALNDPARGLSDLAQTEARLLQHVGALRHLGPPVLAFLREALADFDPDIVAAAVFALASMPELEGALAAAVGAIANARGAHLAAIGAHVRHASDRGLGAALLPLVTHPEPSVRALVLEVLGYRRELPSRASDQPPELLQPPPAPGLVRLRDAADAEAATSSGDALAALALAGGAQDGARIERAMADPARRAAAAVALGLLGDPARVPALLVLLDDASERVRVAAGRGLETLTGAGLRESFEVPEEPAGAEIDPFEAAEIEGPDYAAKRTLSAMRASTDGPAWRAWWAEHGAGFTRGRRWREGRLFTAGLCIAALREPRRTLEERQFIARELCMRSGRDYGFEPDAFLGRQHAALAEWTAWWGEHESTAKPGAWEFAGHPA